MNIPAKVNGVVARNGTQHVSVGEKIALLECRHDAARHGEGHRQLNVTDRDGPTLPRGLHESFITGVDHEIRAEPKRVEATVRSELFKATRGAGRDEMYSAMIEEMTAGTHRLA